MGKKQNNESLKSNKKTVKSKNKTCKKFCKKVFLPERERVEMEYAKRNKMKYIIPKKFVKDLYLKSCNDIYCQKKCQSSKSKWLKSFTKKRKDKLTQQGAISGCRDLHKEFHDYYKNI
jgi:L-rhamnose isomerase